MRKEQLAQSCCTYLTNEQWLSETGLCALCPVSSKPRFLVLIQEGTVDIEITAITVRHTRPE